MRAAIVLAGSLLVVSSAFAAESTSGAASKPIILAAAETQVSEGSLEKFGATGLPQ